MSLSRRTASTLKHLGFSSAVVVFVCRALADTVFMGTSSPMKALSVSCTDVSSGWAVYCEFWIP